MENQSKVLIAVLVVLVAGLFLIKGQITGKAVGCSDIPKIILFKQVGDTVSLDWEDTSTFIGQMKYEALLFKQENSTYDFNNPFRTDKTVMPQTSFRDLGKGSYIVKVRAKNPSSCSEEYSDYAISDEVTISFI